MVRNNDRNERWDAGGGSYREEDVVDTRDHIDHTALDINICVENTVSVKNENEERKTNEAYPLVPTRGDDEVHGVGADGGGQRPKLLLVDDSQLCRTMLARALVSRSRVCEEAEDGRQALEMMRASLEAGDPYDVVLMDLQMPNMNGPEATRRMRRELGYRGIVIGITGNALPEDLQEFRSEGADDVLVKPIRVHQFDDAVKKVYAMKSAGKG